MRPIVLGMETEYGLTVKGRRHFLGDVDARWWFFKPLAGFLEHDYADQDPALRALLVFSESEDDLWIGATGGKIYRDAQRLEYATPECISLAEAVWADKGGERVLEFLRALVHRSGVRLRREKATSILITKNNSDAIRGLPLADAHFYGSHENYSFPRRLFRRGKSLPRLRSMLSSLLIARQLLSGGGGLVYTKESGWQYVISPRGLVTVYRAQPHFRNRPDFLMFSWKGDKHECTTPDVRLHIIMGDSNMMPDALYWRLSLMCAWIALLSEGCQLNPPLFESVGEACDIFAKDITLQSKVRITKRGWWTMPQVLLEWIEIFSGACIARPDAISDEVRTCLTEAHALVQDAVSDPEALSLRTDWGLKFMLLQEYCRRHGVLFSDAKARRFDVQYSDISERGIYNSWQRSCGRRNPFDEEEMRCAVWDHHAAPRAELRKRHIAAMVKSGISGGYYDWGVFDALGKAVVISDPLCGTHEEVEKQIIASMKGAADGGA